MIQYKFQVLLARYFRQECTKEEKRALDDWYEKMLRQSHIDWEIQDEKEIEQLNKCIKSNIWKETILKESKRSVSNRSKWYDLAATLVLFVLFSVSMYQFQFTNIKTTHFHYMEGIRLTTADGQMMDIKSATQQDLAIYGLKKESTDGLLTLKVIADPSDSRSVVNILRTGAQEQLQLELLDGTRIWLNASSEIRYHPQGNISDLRTVIVDGEAYFEVEKHPSVTFQAQIDDQLIEVLGTSFNLSNQNTDIECALFEGSVKLGNHILQPGEIIRINASKYEINKFDTDELASWREGYINFTDADLESICIKLSNWYQVDLKPAEKISHKHLTGTLSLHASLEENVEILSKISGVSFKTEGRSRTIKP